MKTKCFICHNELDDNSCLCLNCANVLRSKYGKDFKKVVNHYRQILIKHSGGKKMDSYKCSCGAYTTNEDGICDICANEPEGEEE